MITLPIFILTTVISKQKKNGEKQLVLEEMEKVKKSYVHLVRGFGAVLTSPVE